MKRYALVCCDNEGTIDLTLHNDYQSAKEAMIRNVKEAYEELYQDDWQGFERALEGESYELLDVFSFPLISIFRDNASVGFRNLPPLTWQIFDLSKMA